MQLSKVLAETISLDGGDLMWIAIVGLLFMAVTAAVLIGGCVAGWKAGRGSERAMVVFGVLVAFTVFVSVVNRAPAGLITPAVFTAFYFAGRSKPLPPGSTEANSRKNWASAPVAHNADQAHDDINASLTPVVDNHFADDDAQPMANPPSESAEPDNRGDV